MPYIRIGPGNYLFGTRNIFTKLDKNGWLMVAIGKEYIDIDSFLLDQTAAEMEWVRDCMV